MSAAAGQISGPGRWQAYAPDLALRSLPGRNLLIDKALDVRLNSADFNALDVQITDRFESLLSRDLAGRLLKGLGARACQPGGPEETQDPLPGGGAIIVLTAKDGTPAIEVAIGRTLVADSLRGSAESPGSTAAVQDLRAALEAHPVELYVRIGHASLHLRDLRNLEAGDILTLDNAVEHGVELCLTASRRAISNGQLIEIDGGLAICMQ